MFSSWQNEPQGCLCAVTTQTEDGRSASLQSSTCWEYILVMSILQIIQTRTKLVFQKKWDLQEHHFLCLKNLVTGTILILDPHSGMTRFFICQEGGPNSTKPIFWRGNFLNKFCTKKTAQKGKLLYVYNFPVPAGKVTKQNLSCSNLRESRWNLPTGLCT